MSGAASTASLNDLHRKLAEQMVRTLDRDMEDDLPTDAATMGVIKGFLKDNGITADPASEDSTAELQRKFIDQRKRADDARNKGLALVRAMDQQTGT